MLFITRLRNKFAFIVPTNYPPINGFYYNIQFDTVKTKSSFKSSIYQEQYFLRFSLFDIKFCERRIYFFNPCLFIYFQCLSEVNKKKNNI
jgi:hypothetical protein